MMLIFFPSWHIRHKWISSHKRTKQEEWNDEVKDRNDTSKLSGWKKLNQYQIKQNGTI